ncbi:Fe-S protein assembly co-chaperone HscB [Chitinophaga defluvii]|uniref:Fe-S protein assembly co-chaperone HscB n=1 Tax=Chitinophaga defluvii TaxID=3163343 RepID=A0ABV2T3L3_9BACT
MATNYFELFNIPVSLHIDSALLKQRYYELSRQYHPDMHTLADTDAQAHVLQQSAEVNKGFKVLGNPELLLQYVLQQKGLLEDTEKFQLPSAFLMEMMELNESLVELEFDPEENEIVALQHQIVAMENALYSEVRSIIDTYDDSLISAVALEKLKIFYFKRKYFLRIKERFSTFAARN